ncbi:MAG: TIGR02206 family membrane protein [Propionibacteriaceae bacterium]|nr:TIGR02206 family membrane protein [Propionibacteriaceae bacterium]
MTQPIPDGVGFTLFGPAHVTALVIVLGGTVIAPTLLYVRLGETGRHRMRLVIGWLLIGMDVVVQLAYLIPGDYSPERIPLQLCSLGVYVIFIDCLRSMTLAREVMYSLTIWGTVAAVVFPDWAGRPMLNVFSLQQFFGHGLLALYPIMLLVAREFRPDWRRLWQVALLLAPYSVLCYVLNQRYGSNLMFLAQAAPGSPMEPIQAFAGAFYIPLLLLLLVLVWVVLYLPWAVVTARKPVTV